MISACSTWILEAPLASSSSFTAVPLSRTNPKTTLSAFAPCTNPTVRDPSYMIMVQPEVVWTDELADKLVLQIMSVNAMRT